MTGIWLVVPIKRFASAKARLSGAFSPDARLDVARRLATHTLDVVAASGVDPAFVVTGDPDAAAMAEVRGLRILPDEGHDHSSAMRAVGLRAASEGIAALVTIAADLPTVGVEDVLALAAGVRPEAMAIAPDRTGTGTNAIAVAPPAFPFAFGPGSLERHIDLANGLGLAVTVLRRPGLAADVDVPEDLEALQLPV